MVWVWPSRGNRLPKLFIHKTINTITNTANPTTCPTCCSKLKVQTNHAQERGSTPLSSSLPDLVSPRLLIVLVTHPYDDQRYREINPIEGEYIYDVERLDDRWCRGTTADGNQRGLFPASYVEKSAAPNEAKVGCLDYKDSPTHPATRHPEGSQYPGCLHGYNAGNSGRNRGETR